MLPYNYSVAWKITSEHYTPMRALVMDFPKDANVLAIADEYMFGPAFLVSPVTTPQRHEPSGLSAGRNEMGGFLDRRNGRGRKHGDGQHSHPDDAAVHVRAGSIVPLGPVVQYADGETGGSD